MASPTAKEREVQNGVHPTKDELIETVVTLLDHVALDSITSEQVLEISGISRGSLYHHFQDFAELLELAQVRRYGHYVDESIERLTELFSSVNTREELVLRSDSIAATVLREPGPINSRLERITAISKVRHNPRMAVALGVEQERLTEALSDLYRDLQRRNLANPALEPRTAAVLFQAYTLGRVVDDFTVDHVNNDNWIYAISLLTRHVFYPES